MRVCVCVGGGGGDKLPRPRYTPGGKLQGHGISPRFLPIQSRIGNDSYYKHSNDCSIGTSLKSDKLFFWNGIYRDFWPSVSSGRYFPRVSFIRSFIYKKQNEFCQVFWGWYVCGLVGRGGRQAAKAMVSSRGSEEGASCTETASPQRTSCPRCGQETAGYFNPGGQAAQRKLYPWASCRWAR